MKESSGFGHLKSEEVGLNPTLALQSYVRKIVQGVSGMKALLLDWETTGIISMVETQTGILSEEVFLTASLSDVREPMMHLKGVVFVRPTRANVQLLRQELHSPRYREYHVFFSNIVPNDLLQQLADADEQGLVKQVTEVYADMYAVNAELFTLNISNSLLHSLPRSRWSKAEEGSYYRQLEGLVAALLAFKKKPAIRYQGSSNLCSNLAREVGNVMDREKELFQFAGAGGGSGTGSGGDPGCLLLIVDRRDDPVTPMLTNWTYQAMVHEMFNIRNNRVSVKDKDGKAEDLVLSMADPFFKANYGGDYGALCDAVKELLETYQKAHHSNKQIQTIDDMMRAVESLPNLKAAAANVSLHVSLVAQLSKVIAEHDLLNLSQLEQEVVCGNQGHSKHLADVQAAVGKPTTSKVDACRLVLLYTLKYEAHTSYGGPQLKRQLREKGVTDVDIALVGHMLGYAGAKQRSSDLFGEGSGTLLAKSMKLAKRAVTQGVESPFMMHTPLLGATLGLVAKGKLKAQEFPFVASHRANARDKPRDVIVFMVGGTTFEESCHVRRINESGVMNVVLGSTSIHNSKSFLHEVSRLNSGVFPQSSFGSAHP